jgi:hypothetical protein
LVDARSRGNFGVAIFIPEFTVCFEFPFQFQTYALEFPGCGVEGSRVLRFGVKVPDAGERRDGGVWEKGFMRERVRVEIGRVRYA